MSGPAPSVPEEPWDVAIVGAGAAGLVAAAEAAAAGRRTLLLEKNRKAGVKIPMSGGTRCNITQATSNRGIVEAFGRNGRFLHSALATFGVEDTIDMFHREGVPTKVEEAHSGAAKPGESLGGKVFPASDKATDVLAALLRRANRSGATLETDEPLLEFARANQSFRLTTPKRVVLANRLVITTGGQSYPGCGTVGDGYRWAAELGHTIVTPRPALVPVTSHASWLRHLSGITIPNTAVRLLEPVDTTMRELARRRGSLLFAHFGLSGPVVLDISGIVSGHPRPQSLLLECDFLPDVSVDHLIQQLRAQSQLAGKQQLISFASELLPRRLCEALLAENHLSPETRMAELGQAGWRSVVAALKRPSIPIAGTMGFKKAEVTAGGVALDEVSSSTMESKLVPGLYFAGEILDLDGPIGGYNFQAAWSTGALAGQSV